MIKKLIVPAVLFALPLFAGAATNTGGGIDYFSDMVMNIRTFVGQLIPVVIAIALVAFLFGLMKYLLSDSDDSKKKAKGFIFFGIIILFVMTTVWGLVALLGDVLNINATDPGRAPGLPTY